MEDLFDTDLRNFVLDIGQLCVAAIIATMIVSLFIK
jgi:hypothetical protein